MRYILCGIFLLATASTHAKEGTFYNRVDFNVEASREVQNDLLVAQMAIDAEDKLPAGVAQKLNAALNDALNKARKYASIKTSSGNQSTYPTYTGTSHISGWHGHGELHIESRDFKAAGELIAELQTTLQLGNVQFIVAEDTRRKIENDLINEAIHAFQTRAEAIRSAMGGKIFKTVHIAINQGGMPQPYPRVAMMRTMAAEAIPAPEFSGGDSRLTVQVSGTIEIQ
jgi:predicted secreted protein